MRFTAGLHLIAKWSARTSEPLAQVARRPLAIRDRTIPTTRIPVQMGILTGTQRSEHSSIASLDFLTDHAQNLEHRTVGSAEVIPTGFPHALDETKELDTCRFHGLSRCFDVVDLKGDNGPVVKNA